MSEEMIAAAEEAVAKRAREAERSLKKEIKGLGERVRALEAALEESAAKVEAAEAGRREAMANSLGEEAAAAVTPYAARLQPSPIASRCPSLPRSASNPLSTT